MIVRFADVMCVGLMVDDDVRAIFCGAMGDDELVVVMLEADDDAEDDAWIGTSGLCFFSEESGRSSRGLF